MNRMALWIAGICALAGLIVGCGVSARAGDNWVRIQGDQFVCNGQIYKLKGTNYYPRDHMWGAMWDSWDWSEIVYEAGLIQGLGMNCVRILVPYTHGGWGGATPPPDRLKMLEDLVNLLGEKGVRSCVTLFDWETNFAAAGTTREFENLNYLNTIVDRLKNNKYVFMWDVKNEPDHPANLGGGLDNWDASANKAKIVSWLQRMCNAVRARDPNHPVSAGLRWWENVNDVLSFVDVAIFHSYWPNIDSVEIPVVKGYMGSNQKPILVEEFGWPSNPNPCYRDGRLIYDYNETAQRDLYASHLAAIEHHNTAGCIQWMTFDAMNYTSNQDESFEKFFGLWKYSYTLKPAGIYYRDHFPVSPFPRENDAVPPGPVTNLASTPHDEQIGLTWNNPADLDFGDVVICADTDGYPSVPDPDGAVYVGPLEECTHSGVTNGVRVYYTVFARDTSGNYSVGATTSAVPVRLALSTIKQHADGTEEKITNKVVTAVFPSDGCVYVQNADRTAGIRVSWTGTGVAVGDLVSVEGTMGTRKVSGYAAERCISGATVTKVSPPVNSPVSPVAMKCASVGGAASGMSPGVKDAVGLNNMGLLVRISGKVTLVIASTIYVDDGSNIPDVPGRTGVMVKLPGVPSVAVGDIVSVTGVVEGSIPAGWTTNRRYIHARDWNDLLRNGP